LAWYHPAVSFDLEKAMPHKRPAKGKPMNAQGAELRAVRLELDAAIHKALRIEAAKEDMSMAALVRMLVQEYLKRKAGAK
jgi:hypothetical protein